MQYISTRNSKKIFTFRDTFLKGLAPDGGLFVPKKIPKFTTSDFESLRDCSYKELAQKIVYKFCSEEFEEKEIKNLLNISYKNFRVEDIVQIKKLGKLNLLELFHGPTLAFKDIAMQVIGNMYEKILEKNNIKVNVVVATSGDTGAAAISAIKDKKNMKIFVLHPDKKISDVQRKFMTTVDSSNVFNIALSGNFDDCQKLVKLMFADKSFSHKINMSGVNSINWSRIVLQIVYYFFSYFKVAKNNEKINFSVPTGNFGDIYAGYVAKKMGLPINKLVIATNTNDILARVLNTGIYKPLEVKQTVSPSMDIQVASNFERLIFDIFLCNSDETLKLMNILEKEGEIKFEKDKIEKMKEIFCAQSLSEEETKSVIKKIYDDQGQLVDPHTAVAIGVLNKLPLKGKTIVLSTAHPSKFFNVVLKETKIKAELPENLRYIMNMDEKFKKLHVDLKEVKNYILEKI